MTSIQCCFTLSLSENYRLLEPIRGMFATRKCLRIALLLLLICLLCLLLTALIVSRTRPFPFTFPLTATLDVGNTEAQLAQIDSPSHRVCEAFKSAMPSVHGRDGDMDIAFTLVVHKDIMQVARLLRMIYRENNFYCIHADAKTSDSFYRAVVGLATCFGPNVRPVAYNQRINVVWGYESVLQPQLLCGGMALQEHATWKYLVNIVGQEFPLKTNLEMIAAIKALNNSNLIECQSMERFKSRTRGKTLPLNATWYKGSMYGVFRRDFMQEAVFGNMSAPIRAMHLEPKGILHPDESYFSVLAYNPHLGAPGACLHAPAPPVDKDMGHLAKFVIWSEYKIPCYTKYVRWVCILGSPYVRLLQVVPHLFANKFHADFHPEAYDALERWYFEKLAKEISTRRYDKENFNADIYSIRDCSKYHI